MNNGPAATRTFGVTSELAARLTSARRFAGLSQNELGLRVGLSRDQIATVERCRVPLYFWPGWKICRELNISQLWLAMGQGSMNPFIDLDLEPAEVALGERELFYKICQAVLAERLNARLREVLGFMGAFKNAVTGEPPLDDDLIAYKRNRILRLRDQADSMLRQAERLEREIQFAPASDQAQQGGHPAGEKKSKPAVDILGGPAIVANMSPGFQSWNDLRQSLSLHVAAPGAKAQLARDLGVSRQAVNKWLRGTAAPSAELTFELLKRVQPSGEQQKEHPVSVATPTGQKTQVRKSSYEKQTQVLKKQ